MRCGFIEATRRAMQMEIFSACDHTGHRFLAKCPRSSARLRGTLVKEVPAGGCGGIFRVDDFRMKNVTPGRMSCPTP